MLISKPFLTPVQLCNPYDPSIDLDSWGRNPDTYLTDVVSSETDVPLPPAKPGEKITVFDFAPLEYGAFEHLEHLIRKSTYQYWAYDPEVQQHAIRYSLVDVHNAHVETEHGTRPINVVREETTLGRRVTAEAWRDIAPFADSNIWAMFSMACAVLSRRRSKTIVRSAG